MSKGLEALRKIKNVEVVDDERDDFNTFPITAYLKEELSIIEKELKAYEELTNKPVILYGRTHGDTQALIDTICKNYKEVKITNLEDEKKLKALKIIKEKGIILQFLKETYTVEQYNAGVFGTLVKPLTKEEYDLLKEVLL